MGDATATRVARVRVGKCPVCMHRPRARGRATCRPCRERGRAYDARRYAERRAAGLCTRCERRSQMHLCFDCTALRNARRGY